MKATNWQLIFLERRSFVTVYVQIYYAHSKFSSSTFLPKSNDAEYVFFHMNKPWTTGARLTNSNRRKIESRNHGQRPLFWCVTPISISNQEFLSIVNYVSSLPYKGYNSNWKFYKIFTLKALKLSGSVLEEFACS